MKPGDWVKLTRLEDCPPMLVMSNEFEISKLGYDIKSVVVFWLDGDDCPHEHDLPVEALTVQEA